MEYFLDTVETIEEGVGFSYFGPTHLLWLVFFIIFAGICCYVYRTSDAKRRYKLRKTIALLIVSDELFKIVMLLIGGNYSVKYLPLHLCSINIFIIAYHVYRPSKMLDNFLYSICIPAALAALIFPTWVELPFANFMHIHSFTIHILLATYPIMLVYGKDIKPNIREIPKCIIFTLIMAVPIYFINILLDTNFMFLMYAEPGNPLYCFGENLGFHLLGVPVIEGLILLIMYSPFYIKKKREFLILEDNSKHTSV